MKPRISVINSLQMNQNGVWATDDEKTINVFSYSDGRAQEEYIRDVISTASNLSSLSEELESKIIDWPSEYHLSTKRGNLLRGSKFVNARKVLELGCGCGAITRFLGEQGLEVDAVEGSAIRADIARLRCRDLERVNIINGNFNELTLPDRFYDVVVLIGVMEYAGRFDPGAENDEQAVVRMLSKVRKALKPAGVVYIAIENRLGLKYILGANEDHYGLPYIGVYGYPESQGIKTYDLKEWNALIEKGGFNYYRTFLPFPDYKIPTTILSESFVKADKYAYSLLSGIRSRDYLRKYEADADEFTFWEAAQQTDVLASFSNSFLFILSERESSIDEYYNCDFSHVSSGARKPAYRTITTKQAGSCVVMKTRLETDAGPSNDCKLEQNVGEEEYVKGPLLSSLWLRCVRSEQGMDAFIKLVKCYYEFIGVVQKSGTPVYDLIASNIVVNEAGEYKIIDNEWRSRSELPREFILFRALLYFCGSYPEAVRALSRSFKLVSTEQFIKYCFERLEIDAREELGKFAEMEDDIQRGVHLDVNNGRSVALLKGELCKEDFTPTFHPKLYWASADGCYHASRSVIGTAYFGRERQSVGLELSGPIHGLRVLRFDPAESEGFFHIYALKLHIRNNDSGEERGLLDLKSQQGIVERGTLVDVRYGETPIGNVFVSTSQDPQIVFNMSSDIDLAANDVLVCQIEMNWPRSRDFVIAKNEFIEDVRRLKEVTGKQEHEIGRLQQLERELETIRRSRVWRMAERIRKAFYFKLLSRYPLLQRGLLAVSRKGVNGALRIFYAFARANWRSGRVFGLLRKAAGSETSDYERFVEEHRLSPGQIEEIRASVRLFSYRPKISIIMPVYNVSIALLDKAIGSVRAQIYENWELCIVDDNSTNEETIAFLRTLNDPKVTIRFLKERRNISGASNAAVELSSGEYLAFLDNDDELTNDALYEVVRCLNKKNHDVVYSDEDFIKLDGRLANAHFKPDYSPDLLLSHNYITHLLVVKRSCFSEVGGFRSECDGAQDYDLLLRLSELTENIAHIPKVLYHWRMSKSSTSYDTDAKPAALTGSKLALEQALKRRGIKGKVYNANIPHFYRIRREINGDVEPLVSIIIPFRDKPELLQTSIGSILEKSSYKNIEIIGISNNSELTDTFEQMRYLRSADNRVQFYEKNIPFNFSRLINYGADLAKGEHLLLLNNDIKIISWDWIEALLEESQRPEIGVVGGKLYYPDNTVQHAGIIIGIGGYAGHAHKHFPANRTGYFNRLNLIQNVSAVTGACMMVKSAIFKEVGGFDEQNLGVACNDVDFCLRVRQRGYLNIFTPYSEAYHYESKTRGYEDTPEKNKRFEKEKGFFAQRHRDILRRGDPYYNINLTLDSEGFELRL